MIKNWSHLMMEAYCGYLWNKVLKGEKYHHKIVEFEPVKTLKVLNPDYDSNYKHPSRPKYCPFKRAKDCEPRKECLFNDCPFLVLSDCPRKDEAVMRLSWLLTICKDEEFAEFTEKLFEAVEAARNKKE